MSKFKNHLIATVTLLLLGTSLADEDPRTKMEPTRSKAPQKAVEAWKDLRFGMFIHWGPVALTGHEIGWSRGSQTPIEEYDNLYKQFNPEKFDADEWVAVAKAAGMKYMVLTAKHHDGFCLWDTKQTDYNIMNTPFGRDVVKELAAACKKGGIDFGIYYSTCDWHHPAFPNGSPGGRSRKPNPDLKIYDTYLTAQCEELIRNYGSIFTLWFDVPQSYTTEFGVPLVNKLRKLQPDIMINNRAYNASGSQNGVSHHNTVGDYDTPEQKIGGFQIDRPWETCMTICRQWAWKPNDSMKSLEQCLHTLIRTSGGDGNLLFNVGPMPSGEIEARQIDRLKEMGAWLAQNGESIHGTRGGPWKPGKQMVSTRKGNKVYIHLLKKKDGAVALPALPVTIKSARLLNGAPLTTETKEGILSIKIPDSAWAPIDTIIELTLHGSAMDLSPLSSGR